MHLCLPWRSAAKGVVSSQLLRRQLEHAFALIKLRFICIVFMCLWIFGPSHIDKSSWQGPCKSHGRDPTINYLTLCVVGFFPES